MNPNSPLTGKNDVKFVRAYSSKQLIADWQKLFSIDIADELKNTAEIKLFECNETGLRFFTPTDAAGSGNLYEALEKFDWYYLPHKWEHTEALKDLNGCKRVLEIGCGEGQFVERLNREEINAEGIELNSRAVSVAQKSKRAVSQRDLHEFANEHVCEFDAVCAFQVLEHVPEPKPFIESCIKLLKPGGKLIFCVPNAESFLQYQYTLLDMPPHHMLQWPRRAFEALPKIFPIQLEKTVFEPLASYHVKDLSDAHASRIFKSKAVRALIYNPVVKAIVRGTLQLGVRKFCRGQSLYACFSNGPRTTDHGQ